MKKIYLKILTIVLVFNLFTNCLFAQSSFVTINLGYGLKMSTDNYYDFNNYSNNTISANWEAVHLSLGKGFNFGGAYGYGINKNIGAEIGISYLLGGKTTMTAKNLNQKIELNFSSNMFRINPSLVISAGLKKINLYAKFGLIMGIGSIIRENKDFNIDSNINQYYEKAKFSGGIALGLSSGIGLIYKINDKFSLSGELNMINLSYAPTKGEIIEKTKYGVDQLPNMTRSDKEFQYVDSYSKNLTIPPDDSQPSIQLKYKYPYGSIGFNIGLIINLK